MNSIFLSPIITILKITGNYLFDQHNLRLQMLQNNSESIDVIGFENIANGLS
tara:strand:- start:270 stop:425 length:156 start_codon:yes stop_codon:yes gene_type:complete